MVTINHFINLNHDFKQAQILIILKDLEPLQKVKVQKHMALVQTL